MYLRMWYDCINLHTLHIPEIYEHTTIWSQIPRWSLQMLIGSSGADVISTNIDK